MARLESPRKIRAEDYPKEYRGLLESLGSALNTYLDQIYFAFQGNITPENLNVQKLEITVSTDGLGNLLQPIDVKLTIKNGFMGMQCVAATNITSPGTYPTSQPFASTTITNTGLLRILRISGLQSSSKYSLKFIIYGN